jgi:hypothetical protein
MVVKNLGACVPVEDTVPNLSRSRTVISIVPIKELATEAPNYRGGQSIILPTGSVDLTHKCLPVDALPEEEELKLEASTATMPVWVYGNWWCHCEATKKGLRLDAHLMGIGARFGLTARAKDAVNQEPGTVQLRGSCIRLCTNDSRFPIRQSGLNP